MSWTTTRKNLLAVCMPKKCKETKHFHEKNLTNFIVLIITLTARLIHQNSTAEANSFSW